MGKIQIYRSIANKTFGPLFYAEATTTPSIEVGFYFNTLMTSEYTDNFTYPIRFENSDTDI
jgi:hypothetical protein